MVRGVCRYLVIIVCSYEETKQHSTFQCAMDINTYPFMYSIVNLLFLSYMFSVPFTKSQTIVSLVNFTSHETFQMLQYIAKSTFVTDELVVKLYLLLKTVLHLSSSTILLYSWFV